MNTAHVLLYTRRSILWKKYTRLEKYIPLKFIRFILSKLVKAS